jgi:hypothetical protein
MPRKIKITDDQNNVSDDDEKEEIDNTEPKEEGVSMKEIVKSVMDEYNEETKEEKKKYGPSEKRLRSLQRSRDIKEMNMKKVAEQKIQEDAEKRIMMEVKMKMEKEKLAQEQKER